MKTKTKNPIAKVVKPTKEIVLIKNGIIAIPSNQTELAPDYLATILSNLAYYGYTLSKEACTALMKLEADVAAEWWYNVEETLKEITGTNRKMDKFVVYKNFPQEVLNMTETEYWLKQILMYIGLPNKWFVEEEKARPLLDDKLQLKVLHLANDNSFKDILNRTATVPVRWTEEQQNFVMFIAFEIGCLDLNNTPEKIVFKENLIWYATAMLKNGTSIALKSATDVLRLTVGLSQGDVSLREISKFRNFKRSERRYLLNLLENTSNLSEDLARRPEMWKRLLANLHPNDYNFTKVSAAYNDLYNNNLETFNSKVEKLIVDEDLTVLTLLKNRPGDFMRRLQHIIKVFRKDGVDAFVTVLPKLSVAQLLKIEGYLKYINDRSYRTIAPKGNWSKLKVFKNEISIERQYVALLTDKITETIRLKLANKITKVNLSRDTAFIKLQTSDSELTPYGRGTAFNIPDNITFIRTASYWAKEGYSNTWYDNGWNFFDKEWKNVGTCCWNSTSVGDGAIFSGDPTNSKDLKGRACQMIDLYIDKLLRQGVRYAVWNILCYSGISFNGAEEVYAALQWGEKAEKGKLFEPSRCQLSFQLKGDNMTKYIAYVDLVDRKLIYLDANLKGNTQSAISNASKLQETMPALVEYIKTLPSIYDLFVKLTQDDNGIKIAYSDKNLELREKETAYVFRQENENSDFTQLNVTELLNI